jgi:diguanylate cyclase (GGDEF)-like protein
MAHQGGWLVCLVWLCLATSPALASPPLALDPAPGIINLAPHCDILEDPGGQLDRAQVGAPPWAERFRPHPGQEVDIGHSASAWWLRFRLAPAASPESGGPTDGLWWLEIAKPGLDYIDLHLPTRRGWVTKQSGAMRGPEAREVLHRTYVLALPDDLIPDAYCYLRVRSTISLNFALQLWRPDRYVAWVVADFFAFGVAYGVMLAMIAFNLFLYLTLRHRSYLLYIVYITSMLIHLSLLYGQAPAFLDLGRGWSLALVWLTASSSWIAAGSFSRSFLETKLHTPLLDKAILAVILAAATLPAFNFAGLGVVAKNINNSLLLVAPAICLAAAVQGWRRGFDPAKYFIIAWGILLVGLTLYALGGIYIPRTFITRYTIPIGVAIESVLLSLALGARIRSWREEREMLLERERLLRHLSVTDGLTGLYNKRHLGDCLAREMARAQRSGQPLSLLVLDVDDFKRFNDRHGHLEGDKVLLALARVLRAQARAGDIACRFGGEEFALVLPGADGEAARAVAERVRLAFAATPLRPGGQAPEHCTVSVGVAQLRPGDQDQDLLARADRAMYQAKRQGKNQTVTD